MPWVAKEGTRKFRHAELHWGVGPGGSRLLVGLARWLVVQLARSGTVGYWLLLFMVRIIISGHSVCVYISFYRVGNYGENFDLISRVSRVD